MNSLKSTIIISIILFAVLFLAFVFPRIEFFQDVPLIIQTLFRVFVFIGLVSYLIYLIQELRHWQNRCDLAETTLDSRKSLSAREEEYVGGLGLKLKVDPTQNYNEITDPDIETDSVVIDGAQCFSLSFQFQ
jgi:hypothetical protein